MQESSKEFVEYKTFDELPIELKEKFKSGARGHLLDKAKEGYVDFINQLNKRNDELIGVGYVQNKVKTQVKFGKCGHVVDISSNDYKRGRGCGVCNGKQVQKGVNDLATTHPYLVGEWHPFKNKLEPYNVTRGSHKKIWWKCEKHGHEWESTIYNRVEGNECPFCFNQKVLKGYNDLATTHPQYIKYLKNVEDAYTHTSGSRKKIKLKCPDCNHTKVVQISKLTSRGFSCDFCSDGVSYPEKLMGYVLTRLNINFTKQISYNGIHKYDFYLSDYNVIIETHGMQHYDYGFNSLGRRTLEEEQENDKYKRKLAIDNGILEENYHEIDCRYSTLEWCKPNIKKVLSKYTDISMLIEDDWREMDIQAQKSLKIEVCKYWKENKEFNSELTAQQVADVFGLNGNTVRNYLKWGSGNGFCTYDGKQEKEARNRRNSTFIYIIKPSGDKWFEEPMNVAKLSRQTGISEPALKNNLDKGALKYCPYSKYDPKYIGSRVVSAEVYDNQTQVS